jgi:hypothetical protein
MRLRVAVVTVVAAGIVLAAFAVPIPAATSPTEPTPAFDAATATATEALAYFQRVGPGPGRHLEVKQTRRPDGTLTLLSVANCWGPDPYGYIVDFAPDGHTNTRVKVCVEWASDPRSVRTRQRMNCLYDNAVTYRCRWQYQSELYSYAGGYALRKVTDHQLPGGVLGPYYSTWLTQGDVYYPSARILICAYEWETWIRNVSGSPSWLVRYSIRPEVAEYIWQVSSYRRQVC